MSKSTTHSIPERTLNAYSKYNFIRRPSEDLVLILLVNNHRGLIFPSANPHNPWGLAFLLRLIPISLPWACPCHKIAIFVQSSIEVIKVKPGQKLQLYGSSNVKVDASIEI